MERSVKVLGNEAREVAGWAVAFILFFDTMALLQTKHLSRVGPEPYIYSVYTEFVAGKSPNVRSCTIIIYSSGQP